MGVKLAVIKRIYNIRMNQIENRYREPWLEQERVFRQLILKGSRTSFGKELGLEKDLSLEEYRRRVPPKPYEFFSPYIDRMVKGEPSVLCPGKVRFFSLSSGTTANHGNKYIPFTEGVWQNNRRAGLDNLLFHVRRSGGDFGIFGGQMLFLGGTTNLTREAAGIYAGDLSAITTRRIPFFFKSYYLPGDKIAQVENWEEKIELIADQVQGRDVRLISGIPSWLLVLFEAIRKKYGDMNATLKEMFPEFRLLISGGVNVRPYEELFARVGGEGMDFAESYPASEAFIAIQDAGRRDGLRLMTDYGVFYEFIPADKLGEENTPRYTVAEVETGVNYAIILTTPGGLYSYILGDTVRFITTDPLRLVVTGRTKHFLSAFGEHLIVEETEKAIIAASQLTGAEAKEFHAAPVFPKSTHELPYHEWLVEFITPPGNADAFIREIDRSLCEQNDDYAAHRKGDSSLALPRLTILREGSFYDFMKARGKLGGQNKVPRLKNDRTFADMLHEQQ